MNKKFLPFIILFCGIAMVSTAALMIKYLQNSQIPSLAIAAGRLSGAAIILSFPVFTIYKKEFNKVTVRHSISAIVAGLFLAVHFGAWICSMDYTSVTSSAALVSTTPIWVGISSWLFLRQSINKRTVLGILITLGGSSMIFLSDSGEPIGTAPITGNLLAVLGAIGMCYYLLIGKKSALELNIWVYVWMVYSSAAFFLAVAAYSSGIEMTSMPLKFFAACLLLAIGPQILGHTSFNWSLKHLSPVFISIAILCEPLFTAILAAIFLNENIQPLQVTGFIVLMVGIGLSIFAEKTT